MNSIAAEIVRARRRRLNDWIRDNYEGSRPAFIDATGINQGELSGLLREKSFGEKRARTIEQLAKMPEGYLVNPLSASEMAAIAVENRDVLLEVNTDERGSSRITTQISNGEELEFVRTLRRVPAELRPAALAAVKALAAPTARKKGAS